MPERTVFPTNGAGALDITGRETNLTSHLTKTVDSKRTTDLNVGGMGGNSLSRTHENMSETHGWQRIRRQRARPIQEEVYRWMDSITMENFRSMKTTRHATAGRAFAHHTSEGARVKHGSQVAAVNWFTTWFECEQRTRGVSLGKGRLPCEPVGRPPGLRPTEHCVPATGAGGAEVCTPGHSSLLHDSPQPKPPMLSHGCRAAAWVHPRCGPLAPLRRARRCPEGVLPSEKPPAKSRAV